MINENVIHTGTAVIKEGITLHVITAFVFVGCSALIMLFLRELDFYQVYVLFLCWVHVPSGN